MDKIGRRDFIKYITFGGGTLIIASIGTYFIFKNFKVVDSIISDLSASVKGTIIKDKIFIEEYCYDFSQVIRKEPRIVVIPEHEEDIINTVKIANTYHVPITVRGAAHSCFGQSLSEGGILLVNKADSCNVVFDNELISVPAKMKWYELEHKLNERNLTSPVLTDYLELTLGGTLSVGGFGLRSFIYGGQVDNIMEMDVISFNGINVHCSCDDNRELFDYSLCGLGQFGIISRVIFKPVVYKKFTRVFYIFFLSADDLIDNIRLLLETDFKYNIDHFSAYIDSNNFICEIGRSYSREDDMLKDIFNIKGLFNDFKERVFIDYHFSIHSSREKWFKRISNAHHLMEDYIFNSLENLRVFLKNIVSPKKLLLDRGVFPEIYILVSNACKARNIPFSPVYSRENDFFYGIGIYYTIKYGDIGNISFVRKKLDEQMELCIKLSGRPYLYGWHNLSELQKDEIYGKKYEELKELKKKYDPKYIYNPGVFAPVL